MKQKPASTFCTNKSMPGIHHEQKQKTLALFIGAVSKKVIVHQLG